MIELHESTRVWSVWFVSYPGGDWLAVLLQQEGDPLPSVTYRFRYDADEEGGADARSWYRARSEGEAATPTPTPDVLAEELAKIAGRVADAVARLRGGEIHVVEVNGDGRRALDLISAQPWSRITVARPEVRA